MSNIVADVMTSFQSDLKRFSVTIAELSIAKLRLLKRKQKQKPSTSKMKHSLRNVKDSRNTMTLSKLANAHSATVI